MKMRVIGTILLALIVVVLGMVSCSGGDKIDDSGGEPAKMRLEREKKIKAQKLAETRKLNPEIIAPPEGWLKSVTLSHQKGPDGNEMKVQVKTTKPLEKKQYLTYITWKNSEKSPEKNK
jgi:hypothetical protein